MLREVNTRRNLLSIIIGLALVWGCGGGGDPGQIDGGASDTLAPDGGPDASVDELTLSLVPAQMKSYVGGTVLLLAEVEVEPASAPVALEASADPQLAVSVLPAKSVVGPAVVELMLKPAAQHLAQDITVELTATAGGRVAKKTAVVSVVDWPPPDPVDSIRDQFVAYLEQNKPELGITANTTWEWWGNSPEILVVAHHLYLSDEWELGISVHVTIPPHDWAIAYLRRRSELAPSWAAKIASLKTDPTISEQTPPEQVTR